ncbi:hypothetical protein [Paenibacillus campi]|uniref:hypothetical protein n=1 Tax=Paenibacillus campi TaxID=3106031 RepID=UPI002AFF057D|nr:hypothetical protein [Paenibacillus sp. SGZ-1014]
MRIFATQKTVPNNERHPILQLPKANLPILQMQQALGNKALTQLMLSNPSSTNKKVIQRVINSEWVKEQARKLNISNEVRILELPLTSKLTDKISALKEVNKLNIDDLAKKDIGEISHSQWYSQQKALSESPEKSDDREDAKMVLGYPMESHMKEYDGGGYQYKDNVIIILEGAEQRTLFHEMGHFKQNESNYNSSNVHPKILDYHNIILYENLYENPQNNQKEQLRTYYSNKHKTNSNNSWADLITNSAITATEKKLLAEIDEALKNDKYKNSADEIKQNLVNEYFVDNPT